MNTFLLLEYIKQNRLLCLLGLLLCSYFTVQPWDRHAADAAWVLISLISAGVIIQKKAKNYSLSTPKELKNIYWVMAAIPVVSIICFITSPLPDLPTRYLEPDIRWFLAIPMIMAFRELKLTPIWILIAFSCYALSSFLTAMLDTQYLSKLTIRIDGDENAVPFGMFTATIALLVLIFFTSEWIKKQFTSKQARLLTRTFLLLLFSALVITTYLSGTRAAFALILIGIVLLYILVYPLKKSITGITLLLTTLILLVISNSESALLQKLLSAPERVSSYFETYDTQSRLKNQRLEQWIEASCIFKKHPLTGTGPRSFREAHQTYGGKEHCDAVQHLKQGAYQAHSVYFDTLFSKGLLGIMIFSALILSLIKAMKTRWQSHSDHIRLGCLLLFMAMASHLINGLTLDLWFKNHVMGKNLIVLVLPLALIFHKHTQQPS